MEIWPCNTSFLCRFHCGILEYEYSTTFFHTKKINKNYLNQVDFCVDRFLSMTILSMFRLFFVTLTSKCVLYMHFDLLMTKNYLRNFSQSPNLAIETRYENNYWFTDFPTIIIVINLNHKKINIILTLNGWNWFFSVVKIYFFSIGRKILLRDERDELRDNQRKHRYTVEYMYVYRRHFGSGDDTYTRALFIGTLSRAAITQLSIVKRCWSPRLISLGPYHYVNYQKFITVYSLYTVKSNWVNSTIYCCYLSTGSFSTYFVGFPASLTRPTARKTRNGKSGAKQY